MTEIKRGGWWLQVTKNLRRNFLTGLLVVTPTVVAAWVLYRLFLWVDGILWEDVRFGWLKEGGIPGVGAVTVLLLVVLIGLMVNNFLGRAFYGFWEAVATRIPLFNKIYLAVKQIGEALLAGERTVFRAVGLIQYPRKGIWCIVFLTEPPGTEVQQHTDSKVRSVFLPTTPNPTSGFLLMVPEEDIRVLDMSVENGLKMVISGGAYVPEDMAAAAARPTERRRGLRFWRRRGEDLPPDAESAADADEAAAPDAAGDAPPDDGTGADDRAR